MRPEKFQSGNLLVVQLLELQQVLIAVHGDLLVACKQRLGAVGELAGQTAVTGLVHQEGAGSSSSLGSLESTVNLPVSSSGVEAEQVPVAALDGLLHLGLAVGHAALDAVHLAGSIADDQGRDRDRPQPPEWP